MLIAFSFRAKPGHESEFEQALNNPDSGRAFATMMGATRNTLFLKAGRMIRVLEFPEGVQPVSFGDLARRDPKVREFLERLGGLIEDGFNPDVPGSLEAFNDRNTYPLAYDVRV